MEHKFSKKDEITKKLIFILSIIILVVFYYSVGCPIRWMTGVSCPSCGMTRAAMALLRFDFTAAYNYHPLIFILPIVAIVYFFRKRLSKKAQTFFFVLFIALMLIVYILRMLSGSEIVFINFESGIFHKIYYSLKGVLK